MSVIKARLAIVLLVATIVAGCVRTQVFYRDLSQGDEAVCSADLNRAIKQEVTADGTVTRILGTRRGPSGTHEGFLLRLSSGCDLTLRVETNTDLTGPVPISRDEHVTVKGEYIYNSLGGVLHWTHHDPRGRHEGGYVEANGKIYQ